MSSAVRNVAIIGGGPAGLMAAEVLSSKGLQVDLYDAMPSVGRKFLLAGKGGLNLTHSEPPDLFLTRYGHRQVEIARLLEISPHTVTAHVKKIAAVAVRREPFEVEGRLREHAVGVRGEVGLGRRGDVPCRAAHASRRPRSWRCDR